MYENFVGTYETVCNREVSIIIREVSAPRGSTVTSTSLFISLPNKWVRGAALLAGYSRVGAHCTKYFFYILAKCKILETTLLEMCQSKDLAKDFRGTARN